MAEELSEIPPGYSVLGGIKSLISYMTSFVLDSGEELESTESGDAEDTKPRDTDSEYTMPGIYPETIESVKGLKNTEETMSCQSVFSKPVFTDPANPIFKDTSMVPLDKPQAIDKSQNTETSKFANAIFQDIIALDELGSFCDAMKFPVTLQPREIHLPACMASVWCIERLTGLNLRHDERIFHDFGKWGLFWEKTHNVDIFWYTLCDMVREDPDVFGLLRMWMDSPRRIRPCIKSAALPSYCPNILCIGPDTWIDYCDGDKDKKRNAADREDIDFHHRDWVMHNRPFGSGRNREMSPDECRLAFLQKSKKEEQKKKNKKKRDESLLPTTAFSPESSDIRTRPIEAALVFSNINSNRHSEEWGSISLESTAREKAPTATSQNLPSSFDPARPGGVRGGGGGGGYGGRPIWDLQQVQQTQDRVLKLQDLGEAWESSHLMRGTALAYLFHEALTDPIGFPSRRVKEQMLLLTTLWSSPAIKGTNFKRADLYRGANATTTTTTTKLLDDDAPPHWQSPLAPPPPAEGGYKYRAIDLLRDVLRKIDMFEHPKWAHLRHGDRVERDEEDDDSEEKKKKAGYGSYIPPRTLAQYAAGVLG